MAELDFSGCMYDVSRVGERQRVIDVFPELKSYKELNNASDTEIRIAFALADFNSPLIRIKDPEQRIIALFEALGIGMKARNKELLYSVIHWKNNAVSEVAALYLFMQNNHDFTQWWNLNQLFYSLMKEMGKPQSETEDINKYVSRQLNIQDKSDGIKQNIKKLEAELFNDSKMRMAVARAQIKKIRTYAEAHAVENGVV